MPETDRSYTVDEVLAFPADGNRYELVDGTLLVTPSPALRHQRIAGEIYHRLRTYLAEYAERAEAFFSPADIHLGPADLVQPDVFVIPRAEADGDWESVETLLLVVEVVSPRSSRHDRITKRRLYQSSGVSTYWIVDPDAALVEVWHPGDQGPEIVTEVLTWQLDEVAEVLEIPMASLFAPLA